MRRFLVELRTRGVLRVATAYLAVGWLTLEIGHTLFNIFELPPGGLQFIFVLLAIGFPVVLLASWQGWFHTTMAEEAVELQHSSAPHRSNPAEGPWLAVVFGGVALFAVAVAIAVRFFDMGHSGASRAVQSGVPAGAKASQSSVPQSGISAPFAAPAHSIGVLSFVNMSGDPKDEYFSDGLSEELLNTLVRIRGLRVAARTSSFAFKGTATDIPTVGRRLNVASVLEGSVRKAGQRVRITAQLINASDGYHLWSDTYDRDLNDIFALQSEIATAVTSALKVTLLGDAPNLGGTTNPKAFDAYLRGKQARRSSNEAGLRAAVASFEEAIALDPGYARAHGRRGEALISLANDWVGDPGPRAEMASQARAAVNRAVALAPDSGEVYGTLGTVLLNTTLDSAAIDAAFRRSVALEPGNAELLVNYADFAGRLGRADALDASIRAISLNPLDAEPRLTRGIVLLFARRYDEARLALQEALRMDDSPRKRFWAGWNELSAGHTQAAVPFCEAYRESWSGQSCLAIAYHRLGRKTEALAELARMRAEQGDLLASQYAEIYAQFGEPDVAMKWLAKAFEIKDGGLMDIRVDPMLDPLRTRPEFQKLLQRLNFSPH